jgi:ribosome maturation factor RimP
MSPILLSTMDSEKIFNLIQTALDSNQELFLIDYNLSTAGNIVVIIDGDHGVPLEECIRISRHIEHQLDREEFDFSLEVTTPDITKPISNPRQYLKNIGRTLEIQLENEKIEGTLMEVLDHKIVVEYQARIPKEIGKGKQTVVKQDTISIDKINKAKVKIVYN